MQAAVAGAGQQRRRGHGLNWIYLAVLFYIEY